MKSVVELIESATQMKKGKARAFTLPVSEKSLICLEGTNIEKLCKDAVEMLEINNFSDEENMNIISFIEELKKLEKRLFED